MASEPLPPMMMLRRRMAGWLKATLAGVAIILAFGLYCAVTNIVYHYKIKAELEAIRRAGFPATLEEAIAWEPKPTGRNAADTLYRAFAAELQFSPAYNDLPLVGSAYLPERGRPIADDVWKKIPLFLADNAAEFALLHQGAAVKECRYRLDMEEDTHLSHLRYAGKMLELEALAKAHQGDAQGAAASVCTALRLAHTLAMEASWTSQWVRGEIAKNGLDALERCVADVQFTDAQLADMDAALAEEENTIDIGFVRALASRRAVALSWFDHAKDENEDRFVAVGCAEPRLFGIRLPRWWFGMKLSGALAADRLYYMRCMRQLIEARQLPAPQRIDALQNVWKQIQRDVMRNVPGPGTSYMMVEVNRDDEVATALLAWLRAARVGVALERFRLANGRLPASVQELAPKYLDAIPRDPYDGKPIRMRVLSKTGFAAYSIGLNRRDEGGRKAGFWDEPLDEQGDVPFTVEK